MPKTLLLADDSVVIQKLVGLSFANEDVELSTTDNGDDAIAKARDLKPDLILADVVMPGKSGYEVCEAIKADPTLQHIPVLLLTGTFEAFDENRARTAGSDGHITKPFEAQSLVDRVTELLARVPAQPPLATTAPNLEGPAVTRIRTSAEEAADDSFEFFDDGVQSLADSSAALAADVAAPPPLVATPSPLADQAAPAPAPAVPAPAAPAPPTAADALPPLTASTPEPEALMPDTPAASTPPMGDLAFDTDEAPAIGDAATTIQLDDEPSAQAATRVDDDLLLGDAPAWNDDLEIGPGPIHGAASDETQLADDLFQDPPQSVATPAPVNLDAQPPTPAPPSVEPPAFTPEPTAPTPESPPYTPAPPAFTPEPPALASEPPAFASEPPALASAPPALPQEPPPVPVDVAPPAAPLMSEGDRSSDSIAFGGAPAAEAPDPMQTMLADDLFSDTLPPVPPAVPSADAVADLDLDIAGASAHGDAGAEDFDVSSSDLEQSIPEMPNLDLSDPGTPQAQDDFQVSDGLLAGAPAETPVADTGAPAPGPGPDLTPMMRERVHETLERVAWEAFSDLSDTVVKQVVEKVEQVAWEVIPQMAESIIREEIRRMKGDSDE